MFDIGATELLLVAVVALVVVGPKELPRLLKTVGGIVRRMRELAAEFKDGVEQLAAEAEEKTDPFADLRKEEGLRPGMSPDEITNHIMRNREREASEKTDAEKPKSPQKPDSKKPDTDKPATGKDGDP